jgi:hypothetical protein
MRRQQVELLALVRALQTGAAGPVAKELAAGGL